MVKFFGIMGLLSVMAILLLALNGGAKSHVVKDGLDITLVEKNMLAKLIHRSVETRASCKCRCRRKYSRNGYECCACPWTEDACFPGDARVELDSGDQILMSRLKVGQKVLSGVNDGSPIYSKVLTFLKRHHSTDAVYLQLKTGKESIRMTSRHVVFTSHTNDTLTMTSKFAHDVVIGDYLFTTDGASLNPSRVDAIDSEILEGVYVPLTESGTIIVDGILASCYSSISHGLAHFGLAPLRWFPTFFDVPLDEHGMHPYVSFMKWIGHLILPASFQGNFKEFTFPGIFTSASDSITSEL